MDRNLLLAFALSFIVLTLWTMSQEGPRSRPLPAGNEGPALEDSLAPPPPASGLQPMVSEPIPDEVAQPPVAIAPEAVEEVREARILEVENGLFRARFSSLGAGLIQLELLDYQVSRSDDSPVVLTTGVPPLETALLTPFRELGLGDLSNAIWEVESESNSEIMFAFSQGGITIRKTYQFEHDTYAFRVRVEVDNGSTAPLEPRFALVWPAHTQDSNDFKEQGLVTLHQGKVTREMLSGLGTGGFFGMFSGAPPQTLYPYPGQVEWVGVETTYFLIAMLPDDPGPAIATFEAADPGKAAVATVSFPASALPSGHSAVREYKVYAGPKEPELLGQLGSNLELAIDVGWSWFAPLTRFFGWLLHQIYAFLPNYGWAIVFLTVLVRLVTAPLTLKQMRSMERMRALQPKLKEIQEKHADDRQKQSEATMAMYRQEKVNPLGGCLPMVLQLPVFIGLFYALRSSIQLRQAPFFGWIDDLSAPEMLFEIPGIGLPLRVLPLVMGATMVIQQRITPMQGGMDPAQARMMMTVMPIMMTVIFYRFASGLVLYWMVSNVLAISHQIWIGRRMRAKG